ncbi:hypothetical protein Tco_1523903 [Tanacetum coccineum]
MRTNHSRVLNDLMSSNKLHNIAMLFGDDDFEDDDSEGLDGEEVWEVNEEWLMAPVTPPPMPVVPLQSVYEVGGPSTTTAEGQSFPLPSPGVSPT